jgi:class 3 adenylate cyclase
VTQVDPVDAVNEPVAGEPLERPRLAAVVFTDVVGYSSRMQRDEQGTIAAVHADFTRMREHCAEHAGEVLNTMGDGMMMCFGGALDAVKFALQMQAEFGLRNNALPPGRGLMHRVGIHIGDVFRVQGGQVAGDGVNIAARLEPRAAQGGICVSQIVYDTIKGKVAMRAESMGPQIFKNLAEPLVVWRIAPEGLARAAPPPVPLEQEPPALKRWLPRIVWGVAALIALDVLWPYRDMMIPPGTVENTVARVVRFWLDLQRMVSANR